MEKFFEIAVGSLSAKRTAVFTYCTDTALTPGQIVRVPLRREIVFGIVVSETTKPSYKVRPVDQILDFSLPRDQLEVLQWMLSFYPLDQGAVVKLFTPPTLPSNKSLDDKVTLRSTTKISTSKTQKLTSEQSQAIDKIAMSKGPVILHGETGSGKTKVYEALIRQVIKAGKSVLIMTPEISLSEQLLATLNQDFDGIITYHSLLTPATRRNTWYGIASSNDPKIIVGPRSALFLPIHNLGLLIMDEAHDSSYKHQQAPHYSTLQVAATLAAKTDSPLVYGSATPNTTDYYSALQKSLPILRMNERPVRTETGASIEFSIISTKDRSQFTRNSFIANPVIENISDSIRRGKQSLLLLNRRGTAQIIRCETCAWEFACSVCDHSLVYHKDLHMAVCHVCDRKYAVPTSCPDCHGTLKFMIVGTKFIEEQCRKLFPHAVVERIDSDSIDRRDIQATLERLKSGESNVLVGTQLLAKGLDLPFLENVVIVDAARQSSDFLSDERYYQLLHQVIGRGSRGHQSTKILIQSASTEDAILQWSIKEDWQAFYERELIDRERFRYPPFTHLASIYFDKKSAALAEKLTIEFRSKVGSSLEVLGPQPSYRSSSKLPTWQIIVKSTSRKKIVDALSLAPKDWTIDFEPVNL